MASGLHPAAVAQTNSRARRGRSLLEHVAVHMPSLAAPLMRFLFRVPLRLREPVLSYLLDRGYAAFNRRDWELNTLGIHPEHFTYAPYQKAIQPLDAKQEYRGVEGYLEALNLWLAGPTPIRASRIERVVDAGGGVVVAILRTRVAGEASGLEFEQRVAEVHKFEDGWRVCQTVFWDPDEALRSVGVDPGQRYVTVM